MSCLWNVLATYKFAQSNIQITPKHRRHQIQYWTNFPKLTRHSAHQIPKNPQTFSLALHNLVSDIKKCECVWLYQTYWFWKYPRHLPRRTRTNFSSPTRSEIQNLHKCTTIHYTSFTIFNVTTMTLTILNPATFLKTWHLCRLFRPCTAILDEFHFEMFWQFSEDYPYRRHG